MKKLALFVIVSCILLPTSCWAQQRNVVNVQRPGTTTITRPDGSKEVRRPDGTITMEKGDQGQIFHPDGRSGGYFMAGTANIIKRELVRAQVSVSRNAGTVIGPQQDNGKQPAQGIRGYFIAWGGT